MHARAATVAAAVPPLWWWWIWVAVMEAEAGGVTRPRVGAEAPTAPAAESTAKGQQRSSNNEPADASHAHNRWRNDEANLRLVRAWNDYLSLTPLTRELGGAVTDSPPVALNWTMGADIPNGGWKNGVACRFGEKVVLVGGLADDTPAPGGNSTPSNRAWSGGLVYDLRNNSWSELDPPPPFTAGRTQGACGTGTLFMVSGASGWGNSDIGVPRHAARNPIERRVLRLTQTVATVPNGSTEESAATGSGWRWTELPALPSAIGGFRSLGVAGVIDDEWLVVAGGEETTPNGTKVDAFPPGFRLRLRPGGASESPSGKAGQTASVAQNWTQIAPHPLMNVTGGALRIPIGGVLGRSLYVFGGMSTDAARTAAYEAFNHRTICRGLLPYYDCPLLLGPWLGHSDDHGLMMPRDAFRYAVDNDTWSPVASLPRPMQGGAQHTVVIDDRYMLLLGISHDDSFRVGHSAYPAATSVYTHSSPNNTAKYYGDDIFCYDQVVDSYTRVGKLLYGVGTSSWVLYASSALNGPRELFVNTTTQEQLSLLGFGGEPMHGWNQNSETVLQVAAVRRLKSDDFLSGEDMLGAMEALHPSSIEHMVEQLTRRQLTHLVLRAAAVQPQLIAKALNEVISHDAVQAFNISHRRVALDGDTSQSAFGRLVTIYGAGFQTGDSSAVCNVTSTDVFEGFQRGFAYSPDRVIQVKADVQGPNKLTCLLPIVPTAGPALVMISMDGGRTFPANVSFEYYAILSFAVGRRPYTVETEGKLLVGLAPDIFYFRHQNSRYSGHISVTATLVPRHSATGVVRLKLENLQVANTTSIIYSRDNILTFSLATLPLTVDGYVNLTVTIGGFAVVSKTRRFVRLELPPGQEAFVVDHHTRGLAHLPHVQSSGVKQWLGTGWFIFSGFECNGHSQAPHSDWNPGQQPGNFTNVINDLARQGFTQLMIYDLDTIVCGRDPATVLLPLLDLISAVGMRVLFDVRKERKMSVDNNNWEPLQNLTSFTHNHPAILGYYVCDDCCHDIKREVSMELYANNTRGYENLKSLDPWHPQFGAIQCPRAWMFLDGPGAHGGSIAGSLQLDVPMFENYDRSFSGHAGQGPDARSQEPSGDSPLRRYPVEYEPLVNCLWGEGTQYFLIAPVVEGGTSFARRYGVPVGPLSDTALHGNGWIGAVHDMSDIVVYNYNKLGAASQGPAARIGEAASRLAFEMQELYPSLTAVLDGSQPRAAVTASTSAHLQPWLRSKAWVEPWKSRVGLSTAVAWDPVEGYLAKGMCKPMGQTQSGTEPCASPATCVHVLLLNTAPAPAPTAVHVRLVDSNGSDTGQLPPNILASNPFCLGSHESLPVRHGVFAVTLPPYSTTVYRLGCAAPPVAVGNLVMNPSFEDLSITGNVASWSLFPQFEQRDPRASLRPDTGVARSGRHSLRVLLPSARPGGLGNLGRQLVIPLSLGSGHRSNCGNGNQGFLLKQNSSYNVSLWVRSEDLGMNVSIASGRWVAARNGAHVWEYMGGVQASLVGGVSQDWQQLVWVARKVQRRACVQLVVSGKGRVHVDDVFVGAIK